MGSKIKPIVEVKPTSEGGWNGSLSGSAIVPEARSRAGWARLKMFELLGGHEVAGERSKVEFANHWHVVPQAVDCDKPRA
jgi:hypothetical protein